MTKLCPRGKAAAKRKFKVYPSAYANAYASRICAGKIKDPSGVKRKDFKGRKPAAEGGPIKESLKPGVKRTRLEEGRPPKGGPIYKDKKGMTPIPDKKLKRKERAGGGLMEATARLKRQGLKGGGMSSRGLGRAFMKGGRV
jgi:hypothetical protein